MSRAAAIMKTTPVLASTRPMMPRQRVQSGSLADIIAPIPRRTSMTATIPAATARPVGKSSRLASNHVTIASMVPRPDSSASSAFSVSVIPVTWRGTGGRSSARGRLSLAPARGEKLAQPDFRRGKQFASARSLHAAKRIAGPVLGGLNERRMDVRLAADGKRVAEGLGDRFDHGVDADLLLFARFHQFFECNDARAPGAEMLGGEFAAAG